MASLLWQLKLNPSTRTRFGVSGSPFRVSPGLGFRVLGPRVRGLGFGVPGLGLRVPGLGFGVFCLGLRVPDLGSGFQSSGFMEILKYPNASLLPRARQVFFVTLQTAADWAWDQLHTVLVLPPQAWDTPRRV